jgi:serine/threonine protein kinase
MASLQNNDGPAKSRQEPAVTEVLEPSGAAVELVRVLDEYLADLQAGKPADRTALLAAHPQMAGQLEQCLAGIEFIHRARRTTGELPAQLGDFRIGREIGRGGMGDVFEAEQLSLHRIVALKILRFGVADREALDRFRYEAETVAKLHHTNIVPIFAIGCENGVNFYAMQYIQGRSLAEVIERKSQLSVVSRQLTQVHGSNPLAATDNGSLTIDKRPPQGGTPTLSDIAGWGLQAAEALAHAHSRGVIHRDIKPSNLLLDDDGTLWLTDFGLAKRMDEVTMTLTGAILGTPRYMSPEQAAASRQPVDHRTDIYSLGATLYELVTGQPVFAASTPHEVISQIITTEPRPPRQFDRSLPRDVETIVLKCLAKDPIQRYQTAGELADDLRAFLDGRPIAARRLGVVGRATRWVKKHRRTAITMTAVAACVAVLLVGGFLAWRSHEESLLGRLSLSTSGANLVAEVLDNDNHPVVPSFPVPTSQPVAVREGSYHIRLSSPGMLSQSYPFDVARGSNAAPDVQLEDRWLWPPMEVQPGEFLEPVSFGRRTDLLVYRQSDMSIRRLDGRTGKPVWPSDLRLDKANLPADEDISEWQSLLQASWFNPWSSSWLAGPPVDLDGDGEPDLIFGSRSKPAIIAISGKTGALLWWFRGRPLPADAKDLAGLKPTTFSGQDAPVIGRPIVAPSPNSEPSKVIACFSSPGETYRRADNSTVNAPEQTWLEAVSGKTGATVWRYAMKETLKPPPTNNNRVAMALEAIGQPQIARVGGRSVVLSAINTKLYGVDLETGKEAWPPLELGFSPDAAPRILDQPSGNPLVLFVSGQQRNGSYNNPQKLTLTAVSLGDRKKLWSKAIDSVSRREFQIAGSEANAPRDVDIEPVGQGGAPTVVAAVTHVGKEYERYHYMSGSTKGRIDLEMLDPATGHKRWEKPLCWFGYNQPNRRWIVGDDLDGDGYRELFVAWIAEGRNGRSELTVAAVSGRDGQTLWRWSMDGGPTTDENNPQRPLSWWQTAENGRPLLVVPVNRAAGGQPATYILDSASGKLRHTLTGVADSRTCDLNGDGLADLLYKIEPQGFARLMAIRGEPPTAYRWLDGRQRHVAQDFDGDELDDLLIDDWGGPMYPVQGVSARDGHTLWKITHPIGNSTRSISAPLPIGDLAGDGRPAIIGLVQRRPDSATGNFSGLELAAYSGRDGHRLWAQDRGPNQVLVHNGSSSGTVNGRSFNYPSLALARLDPRKPADVLVGVPDSLNGNAPQGSGNGSTVWLNVVGGADGTLRWRARVVQGQFGDYGRIYQDEFQDLNGDGVADIVAWVLPPNAQYGATSLELRALSGADGSRLWPDAPPIFGPQNSDGYMNLPVVGDLDGKGTPDVLFVRDPQWDKHELVVVDGRNGRVKWTWSWVGHANGNALPLVVDFAGSGQHFVCLFISQETKISDNSTAWPPKIVVLDGAGKVRKRIDAKGNGNTGAQFYGYESWWRGINLGSGGKQALLFFDEGTLQALGGAAIEPLWKWPLPGEDANLLEVLPAGKTFPTTIAIWSGKSIYGLSCATGRPRWRGEMPDGITNWANGQAERVVMHDANGLGLPRLLSADGCRLTWPTDDDGRYRPPRPEPSRYEPVPDPVALRPLPWTEMPEAIPIIFKMIPWSILWLVVPVTLMRQAFRQNSWRLAFVPALYQLGMTLALNVIPLRMLPFNRNDWVDWDPHVGMCFLTGGFLIVHIIWMLRRRLWALVDASAIYAIAIAIAWSQRFSGSLGEPYFPFYRQWYESLGSMLAVVFGGLPILFGCAFVVNWLRRRQWNRLGLFLVATIICAAICAYTAIDNDRYWKGAEEEYSLDGWWLVLLYGAYFAAILAIAGWLVKWASASLRPKLSRFLKRIRRTSEA